MKNLPVPLLKQGKLECGPTALRMVLEYFGKSFSQKEVLEKIGGTKEYGVKTVDLARFARDEGFGTVCYSYNAKLAEKRAKVKKPAVSDIKRFLEEGLPVIIAVRLSALAEDVSPEQGHFIVITNYVKNVFWYNDPMDGKTHRIKGKDLLPAWSKNASDSSAYLLVLKPNRRN